MPLLIVESYLFIAVLIASFACGAALQRVIDTQPSIASRPSGSGEPRARKMCVLCGQTNHFSRPQSSTWEPLCAVLTVPALSRPFPTISRTTEPTASSDAIRPYTASRPLVKPVSVYYSLVNSRIRRVFFHGFSLLRFHQTLASGSDDAGRLVWHSFSFTFEFESKWSQCWFQRRDARTRDR